MTRHLSLASRLTFVVLALLLAVHTSAAQEKSPANNKKYILLIDNSASMSVTDVAPNRLEWAKNEAIKQIDRAGAEDAGMVIVFNSKAEVLQSFTTDRAQLRKAVASIQPTQRSTRLDEALVLAESLVNPGEPLDPKPMPKDKPVQPPITDGYLFSDGCFPEMREEVLNSLRPKKAGPPVALGALNIRFRCAGKLAAGNVDNIGIVGLAAVKHEAKGSGDTLKLHVQLRNYRPQPAKVSLRLDLRVDGKLTRPEQQVIELPVGESVVNFVLPRPSLSSQGIVHAYLHELKDGFGLDDQAWLVLAPLRKAMVLIVGPGNPVLDAFFDADATKKIAVTERLSSRDLDKDTYRKKARSGAFDLVLFDRCAPTDEADMPVANTFFIDRPPPPWKRGETVVKNPFVIPSKPNHLLLRHLTNVWDLRTHEAFVFDVQKNLDPKVDRKKLSLPKVTSILETRKDVPLLFTMPRGGHTDLVLTFPLINDAGELTTDWPLQTSFPLFLRNVLYVQGGVEDSISAPSIRVGEPVTLRTPPGVTSAEITSPDGKQQTLRNPKQREFVYHATDRVGIYTVVYSNGGRQQFAVNLLDAHESDIAPRGEIRIGGERIQAPP